MRFYVLVLTFFYSNLYAETYDINTFNEYYATSTNVHGHIFTINLKVYENNKILISHSVCYKCLLYTKIINFQKGFKKTNCENNKNKAVLFSVYCNSEKIWTGIYQKQIKGNLTEAFMSGGNALTEVEIPYGKAHFIFLNKKEYLNYKKFIKTQNFITTSEFKNKQEKIIIRKALKLYNENKLANEDKESN